METLLGTVHACKHFTGGRCACPGPVWNGSKPTGAVLKTNERGLNMTDLECKTDVVGVYIDIRGRRNICSKYYKKEIW